LDTIITEGMSPLNSAYSAQTDILRDTVADLLTLIGYVVVGIPLHTRYRTQNQ